MGKIKGKLIKRSAHELTKRGVPYSESFTENKKVLGMTMPSKKIRNQVAGYLVVMRKRENEKKRE